MLTLEQVKNWIKVNLPGVGNCIAAGTIDGDKSQYICVFGGRGEGHQRICIGGAVQTRYQCRRVRILIHWTTSAIQAEKKAVELYNLLYGLVNTTMDGAHVISVDPGEAPIPVGKDGEGICEYVIEATILYERME